MKYKTLQDVPTGKLLKWLSVAERAFGPQSPTAKAYRREIQRRADGRKPSKAVRHAK